MKLKLVLTLLLSLGIIAPAVAQTAEAEEQKTLETRVQNLETQNTLLEVRSEIQILQMGSLCILAAGCIAWLWLSTSDLANTIQKQERDIADLNFYVKLLQLDTDDHTSKLDAHKDRINALTGEICKIWIR